MAVRWANLGGQADLQAMLHEPVSAGAQVIFVLRLRRDTGKAQKFAQLGQEPRLVLFQVVKNGLHGLESQFDDVESIRPYRKMIGIWARNEKLKMAGHSKWDG
jgi:hypothetical protein